MNPLLNATSQREMAQGLLLDFFLFMLFKIIKSINV